MSDRPRVAKTHMMFVIERNFDGMDIRDIIVSGLRAFRHDRYAADHIGVYPSTLSHWIVKLGLTFEADEIRTARGQEAVA